MTCTHVIQAQIEISNLIVTHVNKNIGPYLTPEKVKHFTHGYVNNSSIEQIRQLGDYYPVIDENKLNKKLEEIKKSLSECKCFGKAEEEKNVLSKDLEKEKSARVRETEKEKNSRTIEAEKEKSILSSTKKDNENLKGEIVKLKDEIIKLKKTLAKYEKLSTEEKLDSKREELENVIKEQVESNDALGEQFFELEELFQSLSIHKKDNNKTEIEKVRKEIAKVKGNLTKNGMKVSQVKKTSEIFEEIAKLEFQLDGEQQQYQAQIELPSNQ